MDNKKLTIKITSTPELVNQFVDFLPLEMVDFMSGKLQCVEDKNHVHRFLKLDANILTELIEKKAKNIKEGGVE